MKTLILSILASAALFACASAPVAPTPPSPEKVVDSEPSKKTTRIVTVRVPVELKASIRFSDGTLDEYSQSEYDSSFTHIQAQSKYSASGALRERIEYAYRDGLLASKTTKDGEGVTVSRRHYTYDAAGRLVREVLEDRAGKAISSFEYGYDAAGHRTAWIVKDAGGTPIAETTYSYTGGKVLAAELRDGAGKKNGASAYEYDAEGHIVVQRFQDALGSLLRVETTVWKDGRIAKEERATAGGLVQQRSTYEYGADGQVVRKTFEDLIGKSKQIIEYEYTIREDQKTIEE